MITINNSNSRLSQGTIYVDSFSQISCPKNIIFVVVDKKGNIVEQANNSAGVFSMKQGLPLALPTLKRTVEFAALEENFIIQCPG